MAKMKFVSTTLLFIFSSVSAQSYNSSFTQYGAGDSQASPNCNTATAACGFYNYPGYNAALSQNLFGVGPGAGAGPACGICYLLTPTALTTGAPIEGATPIVVRVNNLCPATANNPLCSQATLSDTNSLGQSPPNPHIRLHEKLANPAHLLAGQNVNFDICIDDGAAYEFFGAQTEANANGQASAIGIAEVVSCDYWSGSEDITSGSNTYTTGPTPTVSPPPPISTTTVTTSTTIVGPPSTATANLYGACGAGATYTGPTLCPPSATCSTQNQYYAQCLPSSAGGSTLTTSTIPVTTVAPGGTQTLFGQCGGGATWTGPTVCQPTATCSAQNGYYSQCLPTS
ncbi:hypothetical protein MMC18_004961 [Xylographa bjoerkii]|nr:hypothetical protein [Xylographa bjoerkii]